MRRVTSTKDSQWKESAADAIAGGNATLILGDPAGPAIVGFGGCFNELGWDALQALPETNRREILDLLFASDGEMRFRIGRLPMGASDYAREWHSYDETDGDLGLEHFSIARDKERLLPFVKEALARNPELSLFASPWSPPTWMKFPKAYNYGTLRWEPEILDAYARYFLRYVESYAAEGVRVRQVHVQNEPVADQKFPSCVWTGAQLRDFIRDYLGPTMRRHSPATEIWLGTLNCPFYNYSLAGLTEDGITQSYEKYAGLALDDPAARQYISGVGYQWGGKNAIERTHDAWPEIRLMQTENECGDGKNSWEYAQYVFNLVRHYFRNGVEAYAYWNMVLPEGGVSTWGWKQNALISVDIAGKTWRRNPEYYLFRHFSRFVRPGARMLATRGSWSPDACAFENADGERVVILSNPYPYDREITIDFGGSSGERSGGTFASFTVPSGAFETLRLDYSK